MKIRSVRFDGIAGVEDGQHSFVDPAAGGAAPLVVVTGPVGSGKTRLLQAIATAKEDVGPYAFRPTGRELVRTGADTAKIAIDWQLDEDEVRSSGATSNVIASESIFGKPRVPFTHDDSLAMILARFELLPSVGKVDYFPASRSFPRGGYGALGRPLDENSAQRLRLEATPDKYVSIRQFLVELAVGLQEYSTRAGESGPERFRSAFSALCSTKRFEGINKGRGGIRVLFSDEAGATYDLDLLSDTERNAVLFAATFVQLHLSHSLVLIDTPELFVGEEEVAGFVTALGRLGVDNQLVVATRSPAVQRLVPPSAVVRLGAAGQRRLT